MTEREREEIVELREKVSQYEQLMEEMMEGPSISGTIISKNALNLIRVKTDDGKEVLLPIAPSMGVTKEGTRVIVRGNLVTQVLPEELELTPEEVVFNHIAWSEIAGLQSQVDQIREAINAPRLYRNYYKQYGLKPCKGILLYGPPGCGKTMVAKAIASEFLQNSEINKDSFIYLKGGELLSPYVGATENQIKSIFTRARNNYRKNGNSSIIFIDEAEALLPARGSRKSSDVETTIVPTFLSEMDGFEDNNTLIILSTNHPNQIDPAIIRPGRIDLRIPIERPGILDTEDIFKLYLNKTKCYERPNILAKKVTDEIFKLPLQERISGAMISNIVTKASFIAIKRATEGTNNGVTFEDLLNVIKTL